MKEAKIVTKDDLKSVELIVSDAQKALQIKSDDDAERAAEVLISLKSQVDSLEEKRKSYIQPAQETINRINKDFKQLTEPRISYVALLKEKVVEYVSGRYLETKKAEKTLQKDLKNRALVIDNGLSKIVTSIGEVRFRKSVDIKVTNKNLVPEKYWILDTKAIEKDLDAGEDIPGVKVKTNPIASAAIYKDKE